LREMAGESSKAKEGRGLRTGLGRRGGQVADLQKRERKAEVSHLPTPQTKKAEKRYESLDKAGMRTIVGEQCGINSSSDQGCIPSMQRMRSQSLKGGDRNLLTGAGEEDDRRGRDFIRRKERLGDTAGNQGGQRAEIWMRAAKAVIRSKSPLNAQ